jgi:Ca-activated chloride channel family protein
MRRLVLASIVLSSACRSQPPPAAPPPELVEIAAESTAELVLAGSPSSLAVRVRVSAGRLPTGERPPLDLVLVMDTSGSMEGAPIAAARDAARELIARLAPDDQVAVVTFDSQARVVVPPLRMTPIARAWADLKVRLVEARGTTDLAGGLALALDQVDLGRRAGAIERIVLVGDGVANDATSIPALVARARQARVPVTTLGLGVDFDEQLLGALALDTGGGYFFAEDGGAIAKVFDEEILRLQEVIARNVVVTVRPGPGVTLEMVPGVEASGPARVAWLGDLSAGESRDVILPLSALARKAGAAVELVDVNVTWEDAITARGTQVATAYVSARTSTDASAVRASVKLPLEVARRRADAASAILDAIQRARRGDVAGGLAVLAEAEKATRLAGIALNDTELIAFAARMSELKKDLAQVAVAILDTAELYRDEAGAGAAAPAAMPEAYKNEQGRAPPEVENRIRAVHAESNAILR